MSRDSDRTFDGSVPEFYDRYMVPLIFEPYAADIVARLHAIAAPMSAAPAIALLEIAAGSGVVTRAMARELPHSVKITATDLSPAMLHHAEAVGTSRPVTWQQADAMNLPFADASFDVVVCQFGAMFFPDRTAAYTEIRRVLRPGGVFLFNVWDSIKTNDFPREVEQTLAPMFPADPPTFMSRTPHGYFDEATIRSEVAAAGFATPIAFDTVDALSRAATASLAATAFCLGTPLRAEIEARDPTRLDEAVAAATNALAARFGATDLVGRIRGFVITASAP